ncbi:DNA transposase THAP9 [Labeo rohita]|uniref:DNA transposase THAP9 n=1 Tax=Labeo rohita TaxID=84645 RepID=A0ABQ8L5F2_LABRO|nr:DNA transposase THAP9 [Labeo rohita]
MQLSGLFDWSRVCREEGNVLAYHIFLFPFCGLHRKLKHTENRMSQNPLSVLTTIVSDQVLCRRPHVVIDRLFDVMNSKNPRARGFKAPLGLRNWEDTLGFMSEARAYLTKLRLNDGNPLHCSKRYLSVTGFVININSFTMMIPELLEGQRYVCTYRFSQDHLELFFNSIRASRGWNNNPTVAHFQNYFRRIMVRCGIAPGKTGNVQPQDDTMCLSAVDMSSVVPAEDDDDNIASSSFQTISGVVLDHSYLATSFGCLTENALVYIARFVVRQVMRKLACNVCRNSLVFSTIPSFGYNYHLLTLRNNGGLVIPSQGTVKCLVSLLNRVVKAEVGSENIFGLCDYIVDTQDGIDSHHFNLISLVVCTFHKLRQHHVAKVHTLQLQSKSLRKKLCKVVLLQGY